MKMNKWILLIAILSFVGVLLVYPLLPEEIPGHWNFAGEVDRYDSKSSVFITGLLPLGIYLLMVFLPKIDPKRASYLKHEKAYTIAQGVIVIMLVYIQWIAIAAGLGYNVDTGLAVRLAIGIMFILLGNYMSQIRHNYFFGIKTPWTLANEEVWKKTHRVGGYGFVIAGIITILSIFLRGKAAVIVSAGGLFIPVVYSYVYSYFAFKKIVK